MKRINGSLIVLALIVGFCSCKKKIDCETPVIKKVLFYSTVSSLLIPDDTAFLVKYKKDGTFSLVSEIFPPIRLQKELYDKSMEFPLDGTETYDYDWEITLRPSNRVFYLSNIKHASTTSKTHHCTNDVSYRAKYLTVKYPATDTTLVDGVINVPGNPYSSTPYYVSDIQIPYN